MPEEGLDQPGKSVRPPAESAAPSARTIRRADGLSKLQALQRVLYRCAKQDPVRRFHALYDKLTRSDVMWQAWCDVAANRGAPGSMELRSSPSRRRAWRVCISFLVNSRIGYGQVVIGRRRCVEYIFPSLGVQGSAGRCLFRRWPIGW